MYGVNPNDFQGVYSMISPLQNFRASQFENQYQNNFVYENKIYPQINTERQSQFANYSSEETNVLTYRSESYAHFNSIGYKSGDQLQNTKYSDTTTFSESQLSSNQIFESENDSFISQNKNPSKNLMHIITNTLSNETETQPKVSHPDKFDNSNNEHKEFHLEDQKSGNTLKEAYETVQLNHLSEFNTLKEKIDLDESEYDIADINQHNFDKESVISSSGTQGCMEICITPPLSSELITSNHFYLPEDNKEESQSNSILSINQEISEDFSKIEAHNNDNLENQIIEKEPVKRKFRFSTYCPKLLNCLFPWIRSEEYFEDYNHPIFYISPNNDESQKLINN